MRILSVLVPSLRSAAIHPCAADSGGVYSQSPYVGGLDILEVLRGQELHVLGVRGQHLVFHRLREGVAPQ